MPTESALAAPYRDAPAPVQLRPEGVATPRTLEESSLVDAVMLNLSGELTTPKFKMLNIVMSVVVFGPLVAAAVGLLFFGASFGAIPVAIVFSGVFGWIWRLSIRMN
jgi:hypothetical protein